MPGPYDYEIDPGGDMILTLINPGAPFAIWHEDDATLSPKCEEGGAERSNKEKIPTPSSITYRISSQHLFLASGRSRKLRHQRDQKKDTDGNIHISVEDWDSEALLTIMNIIHLQNRQVFKFVSLEMLSKLAVVVDYFEFHEAVEMFSKVWVEGL